MPDEERQPLLADGNVADEDTTPSRRNRAKGSTKPISLFHQLLIAAVVCSLCLAAIFAGLFVGQRSINKRISHKEPSPSAPSHSPPSRADAVCLTPDCVREAASILSSIDENVDPCEDFYGFANNQWLKLHPVPEDKGAFRNHPRLPRS
jgi:hypothetical protein